MLNGKFLSALIFGVLYSFGSAHAKISESNSANIPKKGESGASSISQTLGTVDLKTAVKIEDLRAITFFVEKNQIIKRGKNKFSLIAVEKREMNFVTNRIVSISTADGSEQQYCPPSEMIKKLKSSLEGAQICDYVPAKDQMCAQVIRPAVLLIKTGKEKFEIGAAIDSCGRGMKHLCTTQAISSLVKNTADVLSDAYLAKYKCKK